MLFGLKVIFLFALGWFIGALMDVFWNWAFKFKSDMKECVDDIWGDEEE